jgi:hypothetical protein
MGRWIVGWAIMPKKASHASCGLDGRDTCETQKDSARKHPKQLCPQSGALVRAMVSVVVHHSLATWMTSLKVVNSTRMATRPRPILNPSSWLRALRPRPLTASMA